MTPASNTPREPETATERGDRISTERAEKVRPIIRKQAELMLNLAATLARDGASGLSSQIAVSDYVRAGLDRRLAEFVRGGCEVK